MTGSLIVFPTIVNKSSVSSMNGDYDGDVYLICAQKDLIDQIKAHEDMINNASDPKVFCHNRVKDIDERPLVVLPKAPSMNRKIKFSRDNNTKSIDRQTSDNNITKENANVNTSLDNINFNFKTISSPAFVSKTSTSTSSLINDCNKDTMIQSVDASPCNETFSKQLFKIAPSTLNSQTFQHYLFLEFLYYFKNKVRIGKLSNDWFSVASRLGANHKLALLQADYFNDCMSDRKNKYITENSGIEVKKLISNIEDNSVICRLSKAFQFEFLKQDITLLWSPIVITLDEDLNHQRAVTLLPQALLLLKQFSLEFSKIAKQDLGEDPNQQDVKRAVMFSVSSASLQDNFQCFFNELCDQLYDLECTSSSSVSRNEIRKGLASALYEVSYSEAFNIYKSITNSNSNNNAINSVLKVLRCPWTLVIDILNIMKIEKKTTINSTSSLLLLSGIEKISLNDM